jgi:hypothetical protein
VNRSFGATVLRHGVIAGVIGFASVALVFVLADAVMGRPVCYTPSLLGGALFHGATSPEDVAVTLAAVLAYSAAHLAAFLALGMLAAWFAALASRHHYVWFLVMNLFLIVVVHVSGVVLALSASLQDVVSTWLAGSATAVAALAMAVYLIRVEPPLRRELREREFAEP